MVGGVHIRSKVPLCSATKPRTFPEDKSALSGVARHFARFARHALFEHLREVYVDFPIKMEQSQVFACRARNLHTNFAETAEKAYDSTRLHHREHGKFLAPSEIPT